MAEASLPAGAVAFLVADAVLLLEATEGAWLRAIVVLLTGALAEETVVAFLVPAPGLPGFITVVPEEAVEEMLPLRSSWVAGRDKGDRTVFVVVAARLAGLLVWGGGLVSLVEVVLALVVRDRALSAFPAALADVDLRGLDGFRGDMGRERYDEL